MFCEPSDLSSLGNMTDPLKIPPLKVTPFGMNQVSPDPKPEKRHRAKRQEWWQLHGQKTGSCRACGGTAWPTLHHLIPRSLGGSDVADNLVSVCQHCHMLYEDRAPGWRTVAANIRASLSDEELAYMLATKGLDWVLRYYPAEDE